MDLARAYRAPIGVVAICKNEEIDLPGFFHCLRWAKEIVLVDDGSSDSTPALAIAEAERREASDQVLRFLSAPRNEDRRYFSDNRNLGIDASSQDWLLHMDIDERVTPTFVEELVRVVDSGRYDALRFRRLNYFLQRPLRNGAWSRWNMVHAARRDMLRFGGKMHETVNLEPGARVGQMCSEMHHLNDASYSERLEKHVLYSAVQAEDIIRDQGDVSLVRAALMSIRAGALSFLLLRGYREGRLGVLQAFYSTFATFNNYVVAWDRLNRISRSKIESDLALPWDREYR